MRSPLSYVLCTAAICAAVLGSYGAVGGFIAAALITEWLAVPKPTG